MPITILIADDHTLFRDGLKRILDMEPDIEVVAEAGNGHQAVEMACRYRPDVVLMDINMPSMNGIEATRIIRQKIPSASIIALTIHDDEAYLKELIRAGCSGYILKDIATANLIEAIRAVASGASVIHPALTKKVFEQLREKHSERSQLAAQLTDREREILAYIASGKSNKDISAILCIAEKTVKNHVSNILHKLNVADRTQAAIFALKHRIVDI